MSLEDEINAYMNNSERWHEWGLIVFYSLCLIAIVGLFTSFGVMAKAVALAVAGTVKVWMSWRAEVTIERSGDWRSGFKDPDFWYDFLVRSLGPIYFAGIILFVPQQWWLLLIPVGFVGTYKWPIFER